MADRNKLEHMEDGWIAFRDDDGRRWRHRDESAAGTDAGYRVFVSDAGEERRYQFGEKESHDATIHDLREQLRKAQPVAETDRAAPPLESGPTS